jgi:hypothetical protein
MFSSKQFTFEELEDIRALKKLEAALHAYIQSIDSLCIAETDIRVNPSAFQAHAEIQGKLDSYLREFACLDSIRAQFNQGLITATEFCNHIAFMNQAWHDIT